MRTIVELERETEVLKEVDVIVAGGGTAGSIAAIAAARCGAKTLLIERYGFLGGNAAMGFPLLSFYTEQGEHIIQGIPQELVDRLIKAGVCAGHQMCPHHVS